MNSKFSYNRLPTNAIRLIRLHQGEDASSTAKIQTFPDNDIPPYTALSYRWGGTTRDESIVADSAELRITSSLKAFLKEVLSRQGTTQDRSSWPFGWFWIDAVCINQNDAVERSEQVSRMREIYESARKIIIWLGEADDGTQDAFDLLTEIAELDCERMRLYDGSMPGVTCRIGDEEHFVEALYETLTFDVGQVLRSEYWNRAWIIQEASTPLISGCSGSHGPTALVCVGDCTMTWSTFRDANQKLIQASWNNEVPELAQLHGVANGDIATLGYIQDRRRAKTYTEFLYPMLVRSRTSIATDARDKLYSVLGLAVERGEVSLKPDYSLSVEDVYTGLAKLLITLHQSFDCLGSAGLQRNHNVPTWVPDWTVQHREIPQPFYLSSQIWNRDGTVRERSNLFSADFGVTPRITFTEDGRGLVARGFNFDHVVTVSEPRLYTARGNPVLTNEQLWKDWTMVANPDGSVYASGCSRFEAFVKVLRSDIGDVWEDWTGERGGVIEGFSDVFLNVFDMQDAIVDAMGWGRRIFITSKGYMGLSALQVQPNDSVCILFGSQIPLVLRKVGDLCVFVGQAYTHGIMDGEAVTPERLAHTMDFEIH